MSRLSFVLPLAIFLGIIAIFVVGFGLDDRHQLPSPLIGKPFPTFSAPNLYAPAETISNQDILGRPTLVNVWGTWCPTCFAEHQFLMQIAAAQQVRLVGINYKDDRSKALGWLHDYGNPYEFVIEDAAGSLGIELGVYGAPETFLLDEKGEVLFKQVGDVNERVWRDEFLPRLHKLGSL